MRLIPASFPAEPLRDDPADSLIPKPFPDIPESGFAHHSPDSPSLRGESGMENEPNGSWLLPGDPGYLHNLSVAKEAGHVTEGEWERLKLFHQRLRKRVA